jgi:hypothetical protein
MADSANGASQAPGEDPHGSERAEQLLEDWGRRVGRFLAVAAARAREEAEDMLAEAQSIKRGERQ